MKIHHIGYAVKNIDYSIIEFSKLGFIEVGDKVLDHKRGIAIQFMRNQFVVIELIASINEKSPINTILNKAGETPYHICYETNGIINQIEELKKDRYLVVQPPSEAIAIDNRKVAFLYKNGVGLIELVEVI